MVTSKMGGIYENPKVCGAVRNIIRRGMGLECHRRPECGAKEQRITLGGTLQLEGGLHQNGAQIEAPFGDGTPLHRGEPRGHGTGSAEVWGAGEAQKNVKERRHDEDDQCVPTLSHSSGLFKEKQLKTVKNRPKRGDRKDGH